MYATLAKAAAEIYSLMRYEMLSMHLPFPYILFISSIRHKHPLDRLPDTTSKPDYVLGSNIRLLRNKSIADHASQQHINGECIKFASVEADSVLTTPSGMPSENSGGPQMAYVLLAWLGFPYWYEAVEDVPHYGQLRDLDSSKQDHPGCIRTNRRLACSL
jgi:hypothetical protein